MDFFERQAQAQRHTTLLIVYFALAVLGIIAAIHIVFSLAMGYSIWDWHALGTTAAGVLVAVALGSIVKSIELSQGGRVVASMLGGQPVDLHTNDPAERRLINVVEEMAIASGVPVPELFVLDDETINAFAAGHGPGDTAIGVTRGCIEHLSRDELQGVIGHEFSHILHGDMKLNIQLMGVLNGILFLALIGGFCFRVGAWSPRTTSDRDGKSTVSVGMVLLLCGLALYVIGWIGVFFGKLIKAAVSREREFLADASSVQYTRNPEGLASALAKIGTWSSRLASPRAEEASHLFFGNGTGDPFMDLFATHPPIKVRIERIAPGFDVSSIREESAGDSESVASGFAAVPPPLPATVPPLSPGPPQVASAAALIASLPAFSADAVRELHGAVALIYGLLLSDEADMRAKQLRMIPAELQSESQQMASQRGELGAAQKLALVDMAIPTLRHLSTQQYAAFRQTVADLMNADGKIGLFEFALQKVLFRHLEMAFTKGTGPRVRYKSVVPLLPDLCIILSALSIGDTGGSDGEDAAFRAGVTELLVNTATYPMARSEVIDLAAFDKALDDLSAASPDVKRTVLTAAGAVVMHDGVVNDVQIQLLRAMADAVDCPIPPFVKLG